MQGLGVVGCTGVIPTLLLLYVTQNQLWARLLHYRPIVEPRERGRWAGLGRTGKGDVGALFEDRSGWHAGHGDVLWSIYGETEGVRVMPKYEAH